MTISMDECMVVCGSKRCRTAAVVTCAHKGLPDKSSPYALSLGLTADYLYAGVIWTRTNLVLKLLPSNSSLQGYDALVTEMAGLSHWHTISVRTSVGRSKIMLML